MRPKRRWANSGTSWPPGFRSTSPKNRKGETGAELAARAREAGAFIGIAHPAWSQLTIEDGRAIAAAHAVEIYNHGCAIENDRGDGWYLLDQMLSENRRLTAFATDDAHFKTPDHFGGWVHVKAESLDPDVLLDALKAGHFYSSQGPQIHGIAIDGKDIQIATLSGRYHHRDLRQFPLAGAQRPCHHRCGVRPVEAREGLAAQLEEPVVPRRRHRLIRPARLEQPDLAGRHRLRPCRSG